MKRPGDISKIKIDTVNIWHTIVCQIGGACLKKEENMNCPKCGSKNRASAIFCIECGTKLGLGQTKATKSWFSIGLAAIVIAVVGIGAYILGTRSSDGQATSGSGTDMPAVTATQDATSPAQTRPAPTTPSPTPDTRLFWDDFETGIKPDWNMKGDNYNAVDGRLVSVGSLEGNVGDYTWVNYRVVLTGYSYTYMTLRLRVQDENSFMEMNCSTGKRNASCTWSKVSGGKSKQVPGVTYRLPWRPSIEVEGNTYRVVDLETNDTLVTFVDDTVSFGGIVLMGNGLGLDQFEVYPLP